ncbi:acetyl-CoA carboxylase [Tuber brumale]|nr:acetyl-CoA carboxylase [Tuber brumale]
MATLEDLQANADYIRMADQYVEGGQGVREVQIDSEGLVTVARNVYAKGCTPSAEDALQKALEIGFPVMIKASEGGGGKGIRKVDSEEGFMSFYNQVAGEVPRSPIFVKKLARNARHLAIIEEAPIAVANQTTLSRMEKAAVRFGKLVGYVSAGTVEYLYSHSDDKFYFLELNPCLQVEHPTTEMGGHIFAYGENRSASRKHMVVALKEFSIRSDFRTTVEYLIKLLETPAFEDNTLTTGWLDELVSNKLTTERPDTFLAVACGAATKAHAASQCKASLERGQVPAKNILKTVFPVDFIYQGKRYKFTATRSSADSYHRFINSSKCSVGVRALSDSGLLIMLSGRSYNVYWKEEDVGATRVSVDSKTCLSGRANNPTQLQTPSLERLVKFLVENGEHVKKGQAFAEVEVMKMYMPLLAQEDGHVQLIKQPGSTLEAGDILDILALDDPSRVKHATPFDGQLSDFGLARVVGTKPPQRFTRLTTVLKNIIDGYNNQIIMATSLKDLIQKLDPIFSQVIERAKSQKGPSLANQLHKTLDKFLEENIAAGDVEHLKSALLPFTEIMDRCSEGLNVHELSVPLRLMEQYWSIEKLFTGQNTHDEDVILRLCDENRDDINKVVQAPNNGSIIKFFRPILKKLPELESHVSTNVALKAREVLIQCGLPSLEERAAHIEHILRSSVLESRYGETGWEHRTPHQETLKEVIDSKYTVFDVLPTFFSHADPWVSLAALVVYVRRAYRVYKLHAVNYHNLDSEPLFIVTWDFQLNKVGVTEYGMTQPSAPATPTVERGDGFKRVGSMSDLSFLVGKSEIEPVRGVLSFSLPSLMEPRNGLMANPEERSRSMPLSALETEEEDSLPAVCNVAVQDAESMDDKDLLERILPLVADYKDELLSRNVRRTTFICGHRDGSYPGYFTFRGPEYREEQSIRHIEPALAFQLELGRLSNFTIKLVFTKNGNIHVYEAYCKEVQRDKRYFTLAVVRQGRLRDEILTADYLISETDLLVNDILDALEIIGNINSDLNHIFINFTPVSPLSFEEIEPVLCGAEIHIICTDPKSGLAYPLRVIIQNVSGYVIQVEMYAERKTDKGQWVFRSISTKSGSTYQKSHPPPFSKKESRVHHSQWATPLVEPPVLLKSGTSADIMGVSNFEVNNFSMKPAITLQELRQPRILELHETGDEDLRCEHVSIKDFDSWTIENPELEENKHIHTFAKLKTTRFPGIICESGFSESWDNLMDDARLWLLGTEGQTKIVVVLSFMESQLRGNQVEDTTDANSDTGEQTVIDSINQSTTQINLAQMLEQLNQRAKLKNPLIGDVSATLHLFRAMKDYTDIEEFSNSTVLPLPVSDSTVRSLEMPPSDPSIFPVLARNSTILPQSSGDSTVPAVPASAFTALSVPPPAPTVLPVLSSNSTILSEPSSHFTGPAVPTSTSTVPPEPASESTVLSIPPSDPTILSVLASDSTVLPSPPSDSTVLPDLASVSTGIREFQIPLEDIFGDDLPEVLDPKDSIILSSPALKAYVIGSRQETTWFRGL